jgi:predicted ester cyclase
MSPEENKAVIRRLVDEVWNRANLDAVEELVAPEYGQQGTVSGPSGLRKNLEGLRTARPDLQYTIDDLVAEGDRVVLRWHSTGTHTGPAQLPLVAEPLAPTGKTITVRGMTVFRLAEGKLVEFWALQDRLAWFEQLGLVPASGQTPA